MSAFGFEDGQKYRIQNVYDGLYLDLNNGGDGGPEIITNPLDPANLVFIASKTGDGFVLIAAIQPTDDGEQLALDKATDTDLVTLYQLHGDLHQIWIPVPADDGIFAITSARDGLSMQSQGDTQLKCVFTNLDDPRQQWRIIPE